MSIPVAECASSALMRASSGNPLLYKVMRKAMVNDRENPGIAQQHFVDTARCRVTVVGSQHVGIEHSCVNCGKALAKVLHDQPFAWSIGIQLAACAR
jgi:hypothetical protein